MEVINSEGGTEAKACPPDWRFGVNGVQCYLSDGSTAILFEYDLDAIDALRDDGQAEANAGIAAAHDAWERRRFLNETSRELFVEMTKHADWSSFLSAKDDARAFTTAVAHLAAEAAGDLLVQVNNEANILRASGLDVA